MHSRKSAFSICFFINGLVFCLLLAGLTAGGTDQNAVPDAPAESLLPPAAIRNETGLDVTADEARQTRAAIAESKELEEEPKTRLLEVYDKILAQFKLIEEYKGQIETYKQMQQKAPNAAEEIRAALDSPPAELPDARQVADMPAADLETELGQAQAAYEEAQKTTRSLEQEPNRRAERRTRIPEEINAARQQIAQLEAQVRPLPAERDAQDPAQVQMLHQQVRLRALRLRIESLQEEEKAYAATDKLLSLQRDLAARRQAAAERRFRFWDEALRRIRKRESAQLQARVEQQARQAEYAHEVVRKLALENAELARAQLELVRRMEQATRYADAIETELGELSRDFEQVRGQIGRAGQVTSALGVLLLTKKNNLPDIRDNQKQIRERVAAGSLAQLEWSKYDSQWSDLADIDRRARALLAEAEIRETDPDWPGIFQDVVGHLQERREILRKLTTYTMDTLTTLAQLDIRERTLVRTVREYEQFIDENLFWVKNMPALSRRDFTAVVPAIRSMGRADLWKQAGLSMLTDVRSNAMLYILFAAGMAILVGFRGWMIRMLNEYAEKVRHIYSDRYLYTLYALGLTFLLVLPWPLLVDFASWRLFYSAAAYPAVQPLALALYHTAGRLLVYKAVRWFCARGGLGEHFRLHRDFLDLLGRHVTLLFRILIPLTFFYYLFRDPAISEDVRNSMLRFLFLARLILLMGFLLILFRPSGILVGPSLKKGGWLDHLKYVWYGLFWVLLLALCYLSIQGYGYTAHQLFGRMLATLLLLLCILMLNGLLVRWLYVAQTRLVLKQRRQQAEREREAKLSGAGKEEADKEPAVTAEKEEDLIVHISRQTRRLIHAVSILLILGGVFWIWKSIMPALDALEGVILWQTTDSQGQPVVLTLRGVFDALVILVMTIIITRNLPGFLEVTILQRAPFDTGVRFAITSLTRYFLFLVGIIAVSSKLEISWSAVQWLIAAVGVGLGFGLQEIFANFVSGLILLFERPVRVGDVVTIGEITGKVSRIQIRATTIQLWDRKELVVPNKEFITGRLVNWTLTDTVLRLVFPVGVAYGSDIQKTEATLYRVAAEHPKVIRDDPRPLVLFDKFGDSALLFELRVYIPSMECFFQVRHEINCAIDRAFRKEGIEIAFPQQDLHIRSIRAPLPVRRDELPKPS